MNYQLWFDYIRRHYWFSSEENKNNNEESAEADASENK